jgi:hypothetical protein
MNDHRTTNKEHSGDHNNNNNGGNGAENCDHTHPRDDTHHTTMPKRTHSDTILAVDKTMTVFFFYTQIQRESQNRFGWRGLPLHTHTEKTQPGKARLGIPYPAGPKEVGHMPNPPTATSHSTVFFLSRVLLLIMNIWRLNF